MACGRDWTEGQAKLGGNSGPSVPTTPIHFVFRSLGAVPPSSCSWGGLRAFTWPMSEADSAQSNLATLALLKIVTLREEKAGQGRAGQCRAEQV